MKRFETRRRWWMALALVLPVAVACEGFGAEAPGDTAIADAGDASTSTDGGLPDRNEPDAATPLDAARCAECRSGFCESDGGCHPLVFVTSATFAGDLSPFDAGSLTGTARADAICNELGNANRTSSAEFMAWVSSSTDDAFTRLTSRVNEERKRPIVMTNGTIIAESYGAFATLVVRPAIQRTELDGVLGPTTEVWTGTLATGEKSEFTCASWTIGDDEALGTFGQLSPDNDGGWTAFGAHTCNNIKRLYCIELVP